LDQRQEEEGFNETHQGGGREVGDGMEGGNSIARLTDLVTQLLELPFMKNVLVALGEKFVDPQEEGLFLDDN